jgi:hypothetical protein
VFAFVPVLVAQTSLLSALIAPTDLVRGRHASRVQARYPRPRVGAAEYGALGSQYVEGFRRKWLHPHPHTRESLIGSADIQSLADLANAFDVIREMYLVPITKRTMLRLVVAIALPLLPLVLTMIPFEEIVDRAIKTFI